MAREPALTQEQAESLVQGEEHRLLIRHGKPAIEPKARGKLIARVAKAATFERALEIIAAEIEE
jgi:hypothetical protein